MLSAGMRKFLLSAGIVVVSLLVGFAVAEIALRTMGTGYPLFTQADEWTGFTLRPYAAGWQRDEGETFVQINSQGLRDREHEKTKPDGTFRIAVLGDSYAEARQVDMEKAFWSVMEKELQACKTFENRTVEVINFGVSGFGTAQELLTLPRVWDYAPDVVLLAFTTGNDVRNNFYPLEGNPDKPYFYIENGEMVPDFSFRDRANYRSQTGLFSRVAQWGVNRSRVLQLVNHVRLSRKAAPPPAPQKKTVTGSGVLATTKGSERGLDDEVYQPSPTPAWEDAWYITELLLQAMNRDVTSHGAKFIVATLSNGIQVHPDPDVRKAFAASLGVPDLLGPDKRVTITGIENSFMVLLLAPVLQGIAQKDNLFLHGFPNTVLGEGHWNESGHREAGKYLSTILCGSL